MELFENYCIDDFNNFLSVESEIELKLGQKFKEYANEI